MSAFIFGSGSMWAQRTDVANATPLPFGIMQEGSIDFTFSNKPLFGQFQFPVAVGRGTAKVTGKCKSARIFGRQLNDILFGTTTSTGLLSIANGEVGTIPATPYQVTVANSTTFTDDMGVLYASGANAGQPLVKVASSPITGQYSVAAGVYTFAAADTTLGVSISYAYTSTGSGNNQKTTVGNPLLGVQPTFQLWFQGQFNGKAMVIKMLQCTSSKFSLATKLEDWTIPEFDFDCFCDASNNLLTYSTPE